MREVRAVVAMSVVFMFMLFGVLTVVSDWMVRWGVGPVLAQVVLPTFLVSLPAVWMIRRITTRPSRVVELPNVDSPVVDGRETA